MKREAAIAAVQYLLTGPRAYELQRLEKLEAALQPWTPEGALRALEIRGATSAQMAGPLPGLARKSHTNFLPLILDVFGQALKVDNYLTNIATNTHGLRRGDQAGPWKWWQRNGFDAKQTGVNRAALHYGVSYVTVLPSLRMKDYDGPEEDPVMLRGASPRKMTALYGEPLEWDPRAGGPVDDAWPIYAMEMKGPHIRLYDEQVVHFIGAKQVPPQSALGWTDPAFSNANNFEYIEARTHGLGVCPVVRFQDRILLDGEEQYGIIEPLLTIQERINETTFEMLVAQYYSAFKQRYVMGWMPRTEADAMRMAASDTQFFKDASVKAGQWEATDLDNYIKSKESALRDGAAIGQVPAQQLGLTGISNISEASLAALEAGKDRKVSEIEASLGESYEQMLRTAAHISGDAVSAGDFASEVIWRDQTARSLAQTVDALGKMATMLGIPDEILWEDIPGWTREKVNRALEARDRQDDRTVEV